MGYPPNCLGDHDIVNNKGTADVCLACWQEVDEKLGALEKERDEANRLLIDAHVRAAADQDEHSAQRAALVRERDEARTDNAELNRLFELQWTRVGEATKLWQAATGRHDTLPDLGELVEWLIKRGDEVEAVKHVTSGYAGELRLLAMVPVVEAAIAWHTASETDQSLERAIDELLEKHPEWRRP